MQTLTIRSVVTAAAVVLSTGLHAQTAQAPNGTEPRTRTSASGAAADYRLMPGDKLRVEVYKDAQLSQSLQVRPDGKVTLPLLGDIIAADLTPMQLRDRIAGSLKEYVQNPVVTVIVTTFVGPSGEQIRVVGEAAKPQILPFRSKLTLLDVMIAVGGLTDFADGNAATIFRVSEGGKLYSVRLRDLVKRGDISANVDMAPGDILVIPQGYF